MRFQPSAVLAALIAGTHAFPNFDPAVMAQLIQRSAEPGPVRDALQSIDIRSEHDIEDAIAATKSGVSSLPAARKISKDETNCGPDGPCLTFSPTEQFVSITGEYAYASPAADQIRGPCPGLNAAANHGYLPRSGVATIAETITGLGAAYGMSPELAAFLAAYAVVFDGDLISMTWSIGGPQDVVIPVGALSAPQGISYSHNKYEGDTSIGRNDAYLDHGNAHSLNVTRFAFAYATGLDNNRYTLDKFRRDVRNNQHRSIANNPYYFAPLFSTTLVAPAAYNFVINFMSNHSAEEPSGYLNGDMFKTFFAVTGDYPNFKWIRGQERIPENWYRRPTINAYNAANVFQDLIIAWNAYPSTFRFGGNLGKTNTYEGVDIANLTGGTFNQKTLFQGDNFACFFMQTQEQAVPDELKGILKDIAPALDLLKKFEPAFFSKLNCPKLNKYDQGLFNKYPGRNYNPHGKATNY